MQVLSGRFARFNTTRLVILFFSPVEEEEKRRTGLSEAGRGLLVSR